MDKETFMDSIVIKNEESQTHEALDRVSAIISQLDSGKINRGEYAYDLFHDAYCNFVAQSQSGQTLTVQGVEMKLSYKHNYFPHRDKNEDRCSTLNIGRYSITDYYNKDGKECDEVPTEDRYVTMIDLFDDETIFEGKFGDISDEALKIIETIAKWSALHYDMFFDRKLLLQFKRAVEQGILKGNGILSITNGKTQNAKSDSIEDMNILDTEAHEEH